MGALVTLAGVGVMLLLKGKDNPQPIAQTPVAPSPVAPSTPPVPSPVPPSAAPVAPVQPAPIAATPAPVATPLAPPPDVNTPEPSTPKPAAQPVNENFNAEIFDPPSNCRALPGTTSSVVRSFQRGDVLVDRNNAQLDSKGEIWYKELYVGCWIHNSQIRFK